MEQRYHSVRFSRIFHHFILFQICYCNLITYWSTVIPANISNNNNNNRTIKISNATDLNRPPKPRMFGMRNNGMYRISEQNQQWIGIWSYNSIYFIFYFIHFVHQNSVNFSLFPALFRPFYNYHFWCYFGFPPSPIPNWISCLMKPMNSSWIESSYFEFRA